MLRLILPTLALVLALPLSLPAHAEKLPPAQLDQLRANFSQACHTTASLITPTWLQPGDVEQVCGCSDEKTMARLKETEFADADNLTKAERRLIEDIGTNSANECMQPLFAKGVVRMAVRQCVANASGIAALQSVPADRQQGVCSCAAERYVKTADLSDIAQIAAPDGMLMQHIGELLKSELAACKAP